MGTDRGRRASRRSAFAGALAILCALLALAPQGAPAAEGPQSLWMRCDGGPEDTACKLPRGIASAPTTAPNPGDLYIADSLNSRVVQYTAWGELVGSFGTLGAGKGQFESLRGVAIDSAGNVYVADSVAHRVQKLDSAGNFLFMIGGDVNKTAVEELRPEAERNLCPFPGHPADECQAGTIGTGPGQFSAQPEGSYITVGPTNLLYVGDKNRIQVFNPDGTHKEELAVAGTVFALASEKAGNLLVALEGKQNVLKLSSAGAEKCTAKVKDPRALASDTAGNLYVADGKKDLGGVEMVLRKFNPSCAEVEGEEFPFEDGFEESTGIAAGSACFEKPGKETDLYVSNSEFANSYVRAYGPAPTNLALCPRPPKAPQISAQYALFASSSEAPVRAEINPRFWEDTTYWVQYGTAACVAGGWEGACVKERPAAPGNPLGAGVDEVLKTAKVFLRELEPDTDYRFRFAAQSGGGGPVFGVGGTVGEDGEEGAFHTSAPAPGPFTACANQALRTGPAALLADCRAYELVSPVDKAGSDISSSTLPDGTPVARNQSDLIGGKFTYTAEKRFGDAVSQPAAPQYIASRDPVAGWSSHGISPPRGVLLNGLSGSNNEFRAFSKDLCSAWLITDETAAAALAPGGLDNANNLYERSNCGAEGYRTLAASNGDLQGMMADGSATVFSTPVHLSQSAPGSSIGAQLKCASASGAKAISYRWLRNGAPIAGATSPTYVTSTTSTTVPATTTGDGGAVIQCQATGVNEEAGLKAGSTQISNPAWVIAPYPAAAPPLAPQSIAAPSASAALTVGGAGGQTLSCDPNAAQWGGSPSFTYRWYRNGVEIAGQAGPTYLVQASDIEVPASFQCEAIGQNAGGKVAKASESLASSPAPSEPAVPAAVARGEDNRLTYLTGEEGGLTQVCVLPDGTLPRFGCSAGMSLGPPLGYESSVTHALAEDGSAVFWTMSSPGPGPIFVRENPAAPQSALEHGAATGKGSLVNGSAEVSEVTTATGAFEAGQTISGRGIPANTTILAVGAGTLTLSAAATESRTAERLSAYSECTEANKACTVVVSERVATGLPRFTTQQATFLGAAADGSAGLFGFDPDKTELDNGPAQLDLYEFEVASRMPALIAHDVIGVVGASEDLGQIYLVSKDVLSGSEENSEGEAAEDGKANLYLYEATGGGSFSFIARLAEADANPNPESNERFPTSPVPIGHTARVTPDGGAAAFMSVAPLTGYDNRDTESGAPDAEVFRYDAATGELSCASCHPSGARPTGRLVDPPVNRFKPYWAAAQIAPAQHQLYFPRALSENGTRLFFESFEALVGSDTNGQMDVYEWEAAGEGTCKEGSRDFSPPAEGCVSLISSGESEQDSNFLDATPNGSDVFFTTTASLVSQDPALIDIYDARVEGGFAPPKGLSAPCEGETCQSAPAPPADSPRSSSAFVGPGNVPPQKKKPKCGKGKHRVKKGGKSRCVKKHKGKKQHNKGRAQR